MDRCEGIYWFIMQYSWLLAPAYNVQTSTQKTDGKRSHCGGGSFECHCPRLQAEIEYTKVISSINTMAIVAMLFTSRDWFSKHHHH